MSANDRQVGGNHYRQQAAASGEQHWDRMWRLYGRGYFIGQITRYAERYHLKNGVQDLDKIGHYLEKLKELETAWANGTGPAPGDAGNKPLPTGPCPYMSEALLNPIHPTDEAARRLGYLPACDHDWEHFKSVKGDAKFCTKCFKQDPADAAINPDADAEAVRRGLGHWKCVDPTPTRGKWVRNDGKTCLPFMEFTGNMIGSGWTLWVALNKFDETHPVLAAK